MQVHENNRGNVGNLGRPRRDSVGFCATTRISRKDFGLTWNAALEAGGLLVGDAVTITLDVQFIKEY